MSRSEFESAAQRVAAPLTKVGFVPQHTQYDPQAFGNGVVRLSLQSLEARLVLDRGQWSVDLAVPEMDWVMVEVVLNAVGLLSDAKCDDLKKGVALEESLGLVASNLEVLKSAFSSSARAQTKVKVEAAQARRRVAVLKDLGLGVQNAS